jgi:hypothetical protein
MQMYYGYWAGLTMIIVALARWGIISVGFGVYDPEDESYKMNCQETVFWCCVGVTIMLLTAVLYVLPYLNPDFELFFLR